KPPHACYMRLPCPLRSHGCVLLYPACRLSYNRRLIFPENRPMNLAEAARKIAELIAQEEKRQASTLELIASENHVSKAVMEAAGGGGGNTNERGVFRGGRIQRHVFV